MDCNRAAAERSLSQSGRGPLDIAPPKVVPLGVRIGTMRVANLANSICHFRVRIDSVSEQHPILHAASIDDVVNRGGTERMGCFKMAVKHLYGMKLYKNDDLRDTNQ